MVIMSPSLPANGDTASNSPRLRDRVVARILGLTRELGLEPGQALPTERELAAKFDVSRNVIRQSFDILEERGLIASRRGSGRYLRTVDQDDRSAQSSPDSLEIASIADILETRSILEEHTVALASQRRTSAELRELARLGAQLETWEDNLNFHVALAAATHNFMLERLVRQQVELSGQLHQREKYDDASELARMRAEHETIVQAVGSRDADLARRLMHDHLRGTRQTVVGERNEPTHH
jgi:GntR family transcriptional regulator, transcriptional repressor for pyruvate dehydrogenase complex